VEEGLAKANNTPYGLSGGVWTDKGAKIFKMTRGVRAGVIWANTFNKFDPTSPFGGYKESGVGREGGLHGLGAYVRLEASAYLRGQVLYRIAEMLEGRREQFVAELVTQGVARRKAAAEVDASTDRIIYYAGWADKYQQIFSAVNPVNSSHFNFSVLEPTGVVAVLAPEEPGLLGLVSNLMPAIVGGNSTVVLASRSLPLSAISFAEVLHASDVPGGVVNILTGFREELTAQFASHMDVNAVVYTEAGEETAKEVQTQAARNIKRVVARTGIDWTNASSQGPYLIEDTQETKTTWHPIGG
jgi:acyl-CoA reductase-like NAD-dependent aldehyde dehydrogenase